MFASGQERIYSLRGSPSFQVNTLYGFFIANQPKSLYLRDDHSQMIEFNLLTQTVGKRQWEHESRFPRLGFSLLHGGSGSRQYLCRVTALYPFIQFPLLRRHRSETSFRLGAGLGWVQKPYDKETNYKNLMIGTHLNAVIGMRLQTEWIVTPNLYFNLGLAFTHLSNGGIRLPNLGLNIPALSGGIRLSPRSKQIEQKVKQLQRMPKTSLYLHANYAVKQVYPLESEIRSVYIITAEMNQRITSVSTVSGGLNLSYDRSLYKEAVNAATYVFSNSDLRLQASLFAGYEHFAGRLSVPVQLGIYVYNKYPIGKLYQMIGLRYKVSPKLTASVLLKAHFGKADYIQYGLGYKIF